MTSQQRKSLSRGEPELRQDHPSDLVHLAAHRGSARIRRVIVRFRRDIVRFRRTDCGFYRGTGHLVGKRTSQCDHPHVKRPGSGAVEIDDTDGERTHR